MTDVLDRSDTRSSPNTPAKARLKVIDCDIHPSLRSRADLNPFLSKRWQEHMETYGPHLRTPFTSTTPYPRSAPLLSAAVAGLAANAALTLHCPNGGALHLLLGHAAIGVGLAAIAWLVHRRTGPA